MPSGSQDMLPIRWISTVPGRWQHPDPARFPVDYRTHGLIWCTSFPICESSGIDSGNSCVLEFSNGVAWARSRRRASLLPGRFLLVSRTLRRKAPPGIHVRMMELGRAEPTRRRSLLLPTHSSWCVDPVTALVVQRPRWGDLPQARRDNCHATLGFSSFQRRYHSQARVPWDRPLPACGTMVPR